MKIPKNNLQASIVLPSILFIGIVIISCIFFPDRTDTILSIVKEYIFSSFSWVYILCVAFFFLFLVILCLGKLGDIRLGNEDEKPEFSFFSWLCMLFSAGMGIGLMFFGVAEPISHLSAPLHGSASSLVQTKEAMLNTLFHWGIHAWAIYGIIGLALAYFGFRYQLPVTLRSGFYPLLKHRLNGFWGNLIDIVALCATIFGLTTTLGFGAMQLNAGLSAVGIFSTASFSHIVLLIVITVGLAILSAISGVSKGIRYMSQGNLILAIALLLFILFAGPTVYLLSAFTENVGYYLTHIIELSFRTFAYESTKEEWFTNWTITYWAWWISWAPFVGLFIAKISKGRTIREFVVCVLLVPTLFNIFWMTVFGNGAIWVDGQTGGILTQAAAETKKLLFLFLDQFPLALVTSLIALLVIVIFFITSADSGIFVINSIASQGKNTFPKWQTVLWGTLLALLSIGLLYSGGLQALQTMTVITALPFAVIMILMVFCLLRGLTIDNAYFSRKLSESTVYWDGSHWQDRLKKIVSVGTLDDFQQFLKQTVDPAFQELRQEFLRNGISVHIQGSDDSQTACRELIVESGSLRNFIYGIRYRANDVSDTVVGSLSFPTITEEENYEPICYFADGRRGYSIKYMQKDELITDVLRQYERYVKMLAAGKHDLYLTDKVHPGQGGKS